MERLVAAWEENDQLKDSFVRAADDGGDSWTWLTHTARQEPRGLASCARLLLLLETSVREDEMKSKQWATRRKRWCKGVISAGRGMENGIDGEKNSIDLLFTYATDFSDSIHPDALTDAYCNGRDKWKEGIASLRIRCAHAVAAANADDSAQQKRASRVRHSATPAVPIVAHFEAELGIALVHELCDGLARWQA